METKLTTGYWNSGELGHQVDQDLRRLNAVKMSLQDAAMQLGLRSKHVELQRLINAAIEEADTEAAAAEDHLNSFL